MSDNIITFENAEISALRIREARNGKTYATGVVLVRNQNGGFESSHPFLTFSHADVLVGFSKQDSNPDATGSDLAFAEGEDAETRERIPAKQAKRPSGSVSGWFTTKPDTKGVWRTTFNIETLNIK